MNSEAKLGKYTIIEELGRGGYGIVYKAQDSLLERYVALKVLHPNLVNDLTFVSQFLHEAKLASQLDHPNIVPVFDYDQKEGRYIIAMGLMGKGSLKDQLNKNGAISLVQAKAILEQVASGLAYAHEHNIIHRDLKPGNILIDDKGNARVSDFGFAKAMRGSSVSMSVSGGLLGTPSYMAPEIWEGKPASPASDIYSLGCITYEMLSGDVLFDGETPAQIMHAHLIRGPKPIVGIPAAWQSVLDRCLARNPSDRYPSANALLEDVRWGVIEEYQPRPTEYILSSSPAEAFDSPSSTIYDVPSNSGFFAQNEASQEMPYSQSQNAAENLPHNHEYVWQGNDAYYNHQAVSQEQGYPPPALPDRSKKKKGLFIVAAFVLLLCLGVFALWLARNFSKDKLSYVSSPIAASVNSVEEPTATATEPLPTVSQPTNTALPPTNTVAAPSFLGSTTLDSSNLGDIQVLGSVKVSNGWINGIKFSPDGEKIAIRANEGILIYRSNDLSHLAEFTECEYGGPFDWLPGTSSLIVGCNDGSVRMMNADTGELFKNQYTMSNFNDGIVDIKWSPNKQMLAIAMNNGLLTIVNSDYPVTPALEIQAHDEHERVEAIAWSPDSKTIASVGDMRLRLWNAETGESLDTYTWTRYYALDWSEDGKWIAAGDIGGGINLHEGSGINSLKELDGHAINIFSLDWSPKNEVLVSAAGEEKIIFWESASTKQLYEVPLDGQARHLCWSADGKTIAVGFIEGHITLLGIP